MKKYKLRKDLKLDTGYTTLYRIERLRDGLLGGYIENENNLSQEGMCWISDNALVFGNAQVCDNAVISDNSAIFGDATISDSARISNNAKIFGSAWVFGTAKISGYARLYGNATVGGNSEVSNNAKIFGIQEK